MKKLIFLLTLASNLPTTAQSLILEYEFDGNSNDGSGNNYDATLIGNVDYIDGCCACSDGCVKIPKDTISRIIVPVEVLDGLHDFRIKIHLNEKNIDLNPNPGERSTVFSGSRNNCINCFGLSYSFYESNWEIDLNGNTYFFTDSSWSVDPLEIKRDKDTIKLFGNGYLLGEFFDSTTIDITSFKIGQRDYCEGGCLQADQSLKNDIDYFKLSSDDYIALGIAQPGDENLLHIDPNPVNNSLRLSYTPTNSSRAFIVDAFGRTVKKLILDPSSGSHNISIADIADGIYLVSVNTGEKRISKKLIISR